MTAQTLLSAVPPWVLLLSVFLLPALEASTFLGVLVPAESAVLLGGVLAHEGRVPLPAVVVAAVLGAVAGDSAGYAVGARVGPALLARRSDRAVRRARAFMERFGGAAVLLGRCAAVLRALVPSLAGAGGLPYRTFLAYNVAGAAIWGGAVAGLGYVAGSAYSRAGHWLGIGGAAAAVVIVVGAVLSRASHPRDGTVDGAASPGR